MSEYNSKIPLAIMFITLGLVIILVFTLIGHIVYKDFFKYNSDCLENIAEDFCESKGYYFNGYVWESAGQFECNEEERSLDGTDFGFTEKELEGCEK